MNPTVWVFGKMVEGKIRELHSKAPLTDVHTHPSLKGWMFDYPLERPSSSPKGFNPLAFRQDIDSLEEGGVGVVWATHYVPEIELFRNSFLIRGAARLFRIYDKLTSGTPFERLWDMIDWLEEEIEKNSERAELAKSVEDIRRIREEGKIAFVHTVEGGHVLQGDIDNLDKIADRGAAYLTLNHFYPDDLAANVDFIPDQPVTNLISFNTQTESQESLKDFGKEVLERISELNIVPDLSHTDPTAREEIFKELDDSAPVIVSHAGVKEINPYKGNLSDEEIQEIADRDGAIGVILYNYWLDSEGSEDCLSLVWSSIKHIHEVTGSWDHIMIGSDFDGFTEAPEELTDASHLGKITQMLLDKGVSEENILKILGKNAMRVLEKGWK